VQAAGQGIAARRSPQRLAESGVWVLFVLLVAVDQVTKALASSPSVSLDPAAGTLMPRIVGDQYAGPVTGALLDSVGVCLVAGAIFLVATRLRGRLPRLGAVVLLAGLSSNLLDRLGFATLTDGARERAVVNWFWLGLGPFKAGNIADCCCGIGVLLLLVAASRHLPRLRNSGLRPKGRPRLRVQARWTAPVVCALAVGALFGWTGYWQGNRTAAVASAEAKAAEAQLRLTGKQLDRAIVSAFLRGDYAAAQLLPASQWVVCSPRACAVMGMSSSTHVSSWQPGDGKILACATVRSSTRSQSGNRCPLATL
jgi:lipoprotein signal peptidase